MAGPRLPLYIAHEVLLICASVCLFAEKIERDPRPRAASPSVQQWLIKLRTIYDRYPSMTRDALCLSTARSLSGPLFCDEKSPMRQNKPSQLLRISDDSGSSNSPRS
jgi:hypothetical protein